MGYKWGTLRITSTHIFLQCLCPHPLPLPSQSRPSPLSPWVCPLSTFTLGLPRPAHLFLSFLFLLLQAPGRVLLGAVAKAGPLAQLCWQEAPLFQLLVKEREGSEHKVCFSRDFKSLVDVLIQPQGTETWAKHPAPHCLFLLSCRFIYFLLRLLFF